MCRIKGFVRRLSLRFTPKPRGALKNHTDPQYAAKLRKLAKKKKALDEIRRTK